MVVLSYILAGLLFYGGLGWLGDVWKTSWLLPAGLILGLACGTSDHQTIWERHVNPWFLPLESGGDGGYTR